MNRIVVHADRGELKISRHIYGHFAEHLARCIYDGVWVGEDSPIPNTRGIRNDIIEPLRRLQIPNVRWPGGNFAEKYHWQDGIGPRRSRREVVTGDTSECNHFGLHEFMDFCDLIGCEAYLCGNVGTGTVEEMQEWVEYLTSDGESAMADLRRANGREEPWPVSLWAVGNENWSYMKADEYADAYLRFEGPLKSFGDRPLFKVACGPGGPSYDWTEVLMRKAGERMDGLAFHHYTVPGVWDAKGSATQFTEQEWLTTMQKTLDIEEMVEKHSAIMDRFDPDKRVALVMDEWGTWFDPDPGYDRPSHYQQNTVRDVLVAGLMLNMFNNHCERLRMANIAQLVNVLQAMILTQGERMFLTPSYHVFEMYTVHHDATLLPVELTSEPYECGDESVPAISVSASRDDEGKTHLSLCNLDPNQERAVSCELRGMTAATVTGRLLTGDKMNSHNTFDEPDLVKPTAFTGARLEGDRLSIQLPAKALVVLELT